MLSPKKFRQITKGGCISAYFYKGMIRMKSVLKIKCPAKVNLSLDVVSRRDDGYHNLEMIMHTINLFDILDITVEDSIKTEIIVSTDSVILPTDDRNLCAKAAKLFLEESKQTAKVTIEIIKNIPIGAGLGGGSSDAAGTLLALNKLSGSPLPPSTLSRLAKGIGADVPFFLYGGCMLAKGIGEILTPLPALKGVSFLVAKPRYGISTPGVYKKLQLNETTAHPDTDSIISAIQQNNPHLLGRLAMNVLETAVLDEYPEISQYKKIMKDHGAIYSLMSGSGSAVFGVFSNKDSINSAYKELKKLTNQVYIA